MVLIMVGEQDIASSVVKGIKDGERELNVGYVRYLLNSGELSSATVRDGIVSRLLPFGLFDFHYHLFDSISASVICDFLTISEQPTFYLVELLLSNGEDRLHPDKFGEVKSELLKRKDDPETFKVLVTMLIQSCEERAPDQIYLGPISFNPHSEASIEERISAVQDYNCAAREYYDASLARRTDIAKLLYAVWPEKSIDLFKVLRQIPERAYDIMFDATEYNLFSHRDEVRHTAAELLAFFADESPVIHKLSAEVGGARPRTYADRSVFDPERDLGHSLDVAIAPGERELLRRIERDRWPHVFWLASLYKVLKGDATFGGIEAIANRLVLHALGDGAHLDNFKLAFLGPFGIQPLADSFKRLHPSLKPYEIIGDPARLRQLVEKISFILQFFPELPNRQTAEVFSALGFDPNIESVKGRLCMPRLAETSLELALSVYADGPLQELLGSTMCSPRSGIANKANDTLGYLLKGFSRELIACPNSDLQERFTAQRARHFGVDLADYKEFVRSRTPPSGARLKATVKT